MLCEVHITDTIPYFMLLVFDMQAFEQARVRYLVWSYLSKVTRT